MCNNDNTSTMQNFATEVSNASPIKRQCQNNVPVMIEHLNRHGEDLKLWGMPVRMVTFLAIVEDMENVSTRVNFRFRDETGSIRGLKWLDADADYQPSVKVNSYARVYGSMRKQQDENYVLIASIEPMQHLNELCVHLMEVTVACLQAEKFASQAPQNHSLAINNSTAANLNSSAAVESSINDGVYGSLTRDQRLILDLISRGDPEHGAERNSIKSHVPAYLVPQVDTIIEFLSSEGHIYTTKTDDHFKKI